MEVRQARRETMKGGYMAKQNHLGALYIQGIQQGKTDERMDNYLLIAFLGSTSPTVQKRAWLDR